MVLMSQENEVTPQNPEVYHVPSQEKPTTEDQPQSQESPKVDRSQMSNEWKERNPE